MSVREDLDRDIAAGVVHRPDGECYGCQRAFYEMVEEWLEDQGGHCDHPGCREAGRLFAEWSGRTWIGHDRGDREEDFEPVFWIEGRATGRDV